MMQLFAADSLRMYVPLAFGFPPRTTCALLRVQSLNGGLKMHMNWKCLKTYP
jgi:hypothetical protein